ncbi:MAG TPA: 4Fe-4S binding protein [Clostridia bacterium]|nr:4Fe-4S binding protein [Clostridia bacterium]
MAGKYEIIINQKWCKNCGICAAFCPQKVLSLNDKEVLVISDKDRCSGCRLCEFRCPDMAISVAKMEVV